MPDRPPSQCHPGIDEAIARFRAAMVVGRSPVDPNGDQTSLDPDQVAQLTSILEAELRSRIDRGDTPTPDDYLGRFGPLDRILSDVFHRLDRPASLETTGRSIAPSPAPMISTETRSPSPSDPLADPDRTRTAPGDASPAIPPEALDSDGWVGREIGGYRILARIGRGGMGQVFRAEHLMLEKMFALKLLPSDRLDPTTVARFRREMVAIGRLHHPNIVLCTDARKIAGLPLLVMELIDGVDLGALTRRLGRLPIPEACALILQAAAGLQHAFERGLVHRDIKPSNLMLDRAGTLKILDLGLALILDPSASHLGLTESRQVVGTFDYTAPEQWDNSHAVDIRADLYSLGCTLYHLLAGSPPFGGHKYSTAVLKMRAHLHDPPPLLRTSRPDVPEGLAEVVHRLLAKDPAERFDDPASLASALAPFAVGADLRSLIVRFDSRDRTDPVPLPDPAPRPPDDPGRPILLDDNVQFTVYRPKVIAPENWYPLLVFAHLSDRPIDAPDDEPDPVEEVRRQAEQVLGPRSRDFQPTTQDATQAVPREELLTIVPDVPGLQFNPPRRSFRWVEAVHREEFRLRAASTGDGSTLRGRISIFLGSILLAEVPIRIQVDSSRRAERVRLDRPTAARPFRRIYASYSDRDRPIVAQVEKYARMLGDSYLHRCAEVRAGDVHDDRIDELIDQADVFQLFWSRNALYSPLVEREWRHALSLDRPHFIRPVYWEEPLPTDPDRDLPPDALRRLAFHRLDPIDLRTLRIGRLTEEIDATSLSDQEPIGPMFVQPFGPTARGPEREDSDFDVTPSDVIDVLQTDSGSAFELTALDASDEFDAMPTRPSDSAVNFRQVGGLGDADSIELAPLADEPGRPDSSDDPFPTPDPDPKDFFDDTDFEVDVLDGSEDQTIQCEARSDFELDEGESGSEIFAIDEEDVDQSAATAFVPQIPGDQDQADVVAAERPASDVLDRSELDKELFVFCVAPSEEVPVLSPPACSTPKRPSSTFNMPLLLALLVILMIGLLVLMFTWR